MRVVIDESDVNQLWIEFRQAGVKVLRVAVLGAVILAALLNLVPGVQDAPGVLLAMLGIAGGWSIVAITGREVYVVDTRRGRVGVTTQSALGPRRWQIDVSRVTALRIPTGGPEDRQPCVVELIAADGTVLLQLPQRLTTLSAGDCDAVGRVLSERLAVPVRPMRNA